ncbi:P-selectin glycoprotein ligand 1 [Corythoichthys intestinalis]|uniref:P-selectin glycoprotein ligand 1 n=1 Tax=Corythoichthys intestinalis TaxID=161448 RepID=UPI0025A59C3F|nr:P-selectin glycoprotein ligand 1 [Corythoichthys intestinalis]
MTGHSINWLLLRGLFGWLSILVSSGLVVFASVEDQTRLYPVFEVSPEMSPDASRSSHHWAISGTTPTEQQQTSGSSHELILGKISSTVPVQIHSSPPAIGIGRTTTPLSPELTLKPEPLSLSRGLISTPPVSSELSKNSSHPTLVQNQNTPEIPTGSLDLSTLNSTPEPLITGSVLEYETNSTSLAIQNQSRPPSSGTTSTGNFTSLDIHTTPAPPEPSSFVHESTEVPIQSSSKPLTLKPDLNSLSSTSEPSESSESSFVTGSTPILKQKHSSSPGLETTENISLTSNTDLTRHAFTTLEPPRSSTVVIQSRPRGSETTGKTDADLTTQAVSATKNPSSISATSNTGKSPMTTQTLAATAAPCMPSKTPTTFKTQPCSLRSVVKPCLVAIACLAGLATAFMVSTIVLCIKLSTRKYKLRKAKDQTEMTFMSSLMPERNYAGMRQRSPVSNGVLVIHSAGDSDEDISDNLTLSSFLQESDRFV